MKKLIAGFIYYGSLTVFAAVVSTIVVLGFGGRLDAVNKSSFGWWGFTGCAILACLVPWVLGTIWDWARRTLGK